ncbi:hypothetical protein FisN_11Hh171 [Fistulifera solaris]|uniref:Histone deacetylase domain-containing protein n=1 Tax=Fistulifera solaris TaxID=1519565 RepID=A0A1Z5JKK3_FISSO|nr:hypothetical protein FisN_11Hh171 [Fistulifera solaris]|eukprot:GAX14372.1 hypothetical protein FisN_11Hh171 [Fistulifera solaris]
MNKFARIAHALTDSLVQDYTHFFRPLDFHDMLATGWLSGPIDATFVERFLEGQLTVEECRRIGFREQTSRPELIERTVLEVAGTVLACQLACQWGLAANVAGGTHHASMSRGAGYTILNDLAVAAHVLPKQRVLVVDCDVHQGDGTAQFGDKNGPLHGRLITLSLHCQSNYPQLKAHSTIDVGLPDGMKDDDYMQALEDAVEKAIRRYTPDFCIYNAGVDIYENDVLGRLKVSEEGIRRRDRYVLDTFVFAGIPVAATVGGGYDKDVDALARRHAIVHEEAAFVWRKHKLWERGAR